MNFAMYAKFSNLLLENGLDAAASYAKSLGFSSVEFFEFIGRRWERRVKSVEDALQKKAILDRHGLSVACVSIAVGLYEDGVAPGEVTQAEREMLRYVDIVAALGSPYLHHTLTIGAENQLGTAENALAHILPAAIRIAKYAHERGVTCIYEDQGPFFNGVEGFAKFYNRIKEECPYVGVCGDVGNVVFVDEEPEPFFRAYAKDIRHVHIKDYILRDMHDGGAGWYPTAKGRWAKESVVGRGDVDVAACLSVLKEIGYTGAFGMENNHEEDFEEGTQIAMEYSRCYFE